MKRIKLFENFDIDSNLLESAFNVKDATDDIEVYFDDYGISNMRKFNLIKFSEHIGMKPVTAANVLLNMENTEVMQNIADGNYDTFNLEDSSQFNDDYDSWIGKVMRSK